MFSFLRHFILSSQHALSEAIESKLLLVPTSTRKNSPLTPHLMYCQRYYEEKVHLCWEKLQPIYFFMSLQFKLYSWLHTKPLRYVCRCYSMSFIQHTSYFFFTMSFYPSGKGLCDFVCKLNANQIKPNEWHRSFLTWAPTQFALHMPCIHMSTVLCSNVLCIINLLFFMSPKIKEYLFTNSLFTDNFGKTHLQTNYLHIKYVIITDFIYYHRYHPDWEKLSSK